MAGEALAAGTSAVLGAVIAVAGTAFVMWNSTAAERTKFLTQIEALNAKVDRTNAAIADLGKASAGSGPDIALAGLSAKLDATNKSLAALTAKIDGTDKALADIKAASGGVGELKTATTAQEQALQRIALSVDSIKVTTEAQKAALAALNMPSSTVAKDTAQVEAAKAPAERELIVVYVPQAAATAAAAAPAGLSVRFDRSANANTQTQKLATDLKKFIGERKSCVVTVAGYADTLGSDQVNLAVSRERAQIVANGLRSALPGVEVKEVAWGERNLAVWTPDNKIETANRRVDVNVECK
ncbi:MAG TPA: OmpA family protein [Pseudolabrys sp.]|nr:OmpA family protein [Pseudolabrys sp.]